MIRAQRSLRRRGYVIGKLVGKGFPCELWGQPGNAMQFRKCHDHRALLGRLRAPAILTVNVFLNGAFGQCDPARRLRIATLFGVSSGRHAGETLLIRCGGNLRRKIWFHRPGNPASFLITESQMSPKVPASEPRNGAVPDIASHFRLFADHSENYSQEEHTFPRFLLPRARRHATCTAITDHHEGWRHSYARERDAAVIKKHRRDWHK